MPISELETLLKSFSAELVTLNGELAAFIDQTRDLSEQIRQTGIVVAGLNQTMAEHLR